MDKDDKSELGKKNTKKCDHLWKRTATISLYNYNKLIINNNN